MPSRNLHELLIQSSSTRAYFLTLPVSRQMALHRQSEHIRTAQELRLYARFLEQASRWETGAG